jgi:hypothetical protein
MGVRIRRNSISPAYRNATMSPSVFLLDGTFPDCDGGDPGRHGRGVRGDHAEPEPSCALESIRTGDSTASY